MYKYFLVLLSLTLLIFPQLVLADDFVNDIDNSPDTTLEILSFKLDDKPKTVNIKLIPTSNDSRPGCNLDKIGFFYPLVSWIIQSSDYSVATFNPSNGMMKGTCTQKVSIAITPLKIGTSVVTLKETANPDQLDFNYAPASFKIVVHSPSYVPLECGDIPYPNIINGTSGDDVLNGTPLNDIIFAKEGNDRVYGNGGMDCIIGGDGGDLLEGGLGNDSILGGLGGDFIKGDSGDDRLFGGDDGDRLEGGLGHDGIWGEGGMDAADGGAGSDLCVAEAVMNCEI
jgi:hypothetical protein